jgi:hypothetical protein
MAVFWQRRHRKIYVVLLTFDGQSGHAFDSPPARLLTVLVFGDTTTAIDHGVIGVMTPRNGCYHFGSGRVVRD